LKDETILIMFGLGYLLYKYRKTKQYISQFTTKPARRTYLIERYGSLEKAYWELT